MTKKEFVVRQLAKTNKKKYENYVVTGIVHRLADPDVKFVTQQHVTRPGGKRALTDLYFPQLELHIEVDEAHHKAQVDADAKREADIINATNHVIERVDVTVSLPEIDARIDEVVDLVRRNIEERKAEGTFAPWDFEASLESDTYVRAGYMDANDDVAFLRIYEACNCFGHSYSGYQRAMAPHGIESGLWLWFPKLYENEGWINNISPDGRQILERRREDNAAFIRMHLTEERRFRRIVFARVKGSLGDVMYRFKGLFETDVERSREAQTIMYNRTRTRVRTYAPKSRQPADETAH